MITLERCALTSLAACALALLAACTTGATGPRTAAEQSEPLAAPAHGPEWTWADRFGGRGRDAPRAVAVAAEGQVYSVGQLAHVRDASERSWSGESARELMFLARHAPDGAREWILRFGGSPVDEPRAVAVAPDGTVLVAGLFAGELGFGAASGGLPALEPVGGADAFLLGIDGDGTARWALRWGGKYADAARALAFDAAGNVYVAGTFQLTADFDPGDGRTLMTSAGHTDVFVLKLDPQRRLAWAQQLGGEHADDVTALAVAADGTVYVGGTSEGEWSGEGTGEEGAASGDVVPSAFLVALAPDGTRLWRRRFVSDRGVALAGVAGDDGAIYVGGNFQGTLRTTGNVAVANPVGWDLFLARLDASGELIWMRDVGAESEQSLTAQALATTAGGPLLAGWFQGSVDFDPGIGTAPLQAETTAGFLLALDANGALAWAASPAASGYSQVLALAIGAGGSAAAVGVGQPSTVFRAGRSTGSAPGLGKSDVFVLGIRPSAGRAEVEDP